MEKKDKESPTSIQNEFTNNLEMLKLCKRKQDIQSAIMRKRMHDINPIAGYNLSSFRPKYKKKHKRCWYCGGKNHKSNSCHSIIIPQLQRLCWDLQIRIESLESALENSVKAAENRKRKQMVKLKKRKKKKHEEQIKAMNKAVTLKTLILKDEAEGWQKHSYRYWLLADEKLNAMKPKEQKAVKKCFKQLFGLTFEQAMLEHIDIEEGIDLLNEEEIDGTMDIEASEPT